jgi:cytochrome c-type biogenesis protein CcmH/NrfF
MTPPFAANIMTSIYWHLPVLLVVVSIVYSATRHDRWNRIFHEAFRWGRNMAVFLGVIALVLFVLSTYL